MGVVYKAHDTKLKRGVALKFLPQELTHISELRDRFMREAQAAAVLDHPNICTVYEFDETEDKTFISMAFIEGKSLKKKIDEGPLELDQTGVLASIAAPLSAGGIPVFAVSTYDTDYFLVRAATENPERGKRFAAVVGIVGALDIPLIHLSVLWFRSLHPTPVVMKPEGPTLDPAMLQTLGVGFLSFTLLFFGVFLQRYFVTAAEHVLAVRDRRAES